VRIGKAATVFGKMKKIWRNNKINLEVKMRLYESVILSALLYSAELWPLTATLSKRLNAAHRRWQRSILGVSWKDKITNEEVRVRTGQHSIENIISERRLRWLGYLTRMDHQRIPQQALYHGRFQGSRGDTQAGQGQTGEASSRKIFKEWDSPGKRWR